jgi:hypothetical protein
MHKHQRIDIHFAAARTFEYPVRVAVHALHLTRRRVARFHTPARKRMLALWRHGKNSPPVRPGNSSGEVVPPLRP